MKKRTDKKNMNNKTSSLPISRSLSIDNFLFIFLYSASIMVFIHYQKMQQIREKENKNMNLQQLSFLLSLFLLFAYWITSSVTIAVVTSLSGRVPD